VEATDLTSHLHQLSLAFSVRRKRFTEPYEALRTLRQNILFDPVRSAYC
jgi:hypothetical protein